MFAIAALLIFSPVLQGAFAQSPAVVTQETLFPPTERTVIRWVFPGHREFIRAIALPTPMGERFDTIPPRGQPAQTFGWHWEPRFRLEFCQWRDDFDRACPTLLGPMQRDGYRNLMISLGLRTYPTFENARRLCQDGDWIRRWVSGDGEDVSPYAVAQPILNCSPIRGNEGRNDVWIPQPAQGLYSSQWIALMELAMSAGIADGLRVVAGNVSSIGIRVAVAGLVFGLLSRAIGPAAVTGPTREIFQATPAVQESTPFLQSLQRLRALINQVQARAVVRAAIENAPSAIANTGTQLAPSFIYSAFDSEMNRLLSQPIQTLPQGELGPAAQNRLRHRDLLPYFKSYLFETEPEFYAQMNQAWSAIQNIEVSPDTRPDQVLEAFQYLLAQRHPTRGTRLVHSIRTDSALRTRLASVPNPLPLLAGAYQWVGAGISAGVQRIQSAGQRIRAEWDVQFGTLMTETIHFLGNEQIQSHHCEVTYPGNHLWNPTTGEETMNAILRIRREGCMQFSQPTLIAPDVWAHWVY